MKHFNTVFDIFLYESIFAFFFGVLLGILNDPVSEILLDISIASFIISAVLGITGYYFDLFTKNNQAGNFD